ncbi:MAG: hypothetical protein K2X77_26520 [Candidatus Obscuribacterales bacterium]|nr:hypothetical protein [Candidatus Obscuribacterales bacterium]
MNKVFVYTHTHWDREWYQPFETFRTYLVDVIKRIVDELETGKLRRFYLDGQSIILEDALAIAPELAPRIKALMDSGELAAGPWYVLSDEILVCGESLIRNLKQGIATIKPFGEPLKIGYCPDTFAHSQDLPRILTGFGIHSAFVWRGVPQLNCGPVFWWQSNDGSQVLAYHLKKGYYQVNLHEAETANGGREAALTKVAEDIAKFAADRGDWDNASLYDRTANQLLYPVGGDHVAPPRDIVGLIAELNKKLQKSELQLEQLQLNEFAQMLEERIKAPNTLVGMIRKELRDNARSADNGYAYLLQGVLSSRLYLKRQNREAERRLFRFAEPLFSLLSARQIMDYPAAELNHATKLLLKNHPHDSICGCSVDAVHDEMDVRFGRIHQVINALCERAELNLSAMAADESKSPRDPGAKLAALRVINPTGRHFTGPVRYQWHEPVGYPLGHAPNSSQFESEHTGMMLYSGWGRVPYYEKVRSVDGWIWVQDLAPFAEANLAWPLENLLAEPVANRVPIVTAQAKTLDNGTLKVTVDERGQLNVLWNVERKQLAEYKLSFSFRDTGDGGDSYNYDPLPGDKAISSKFLSVQPGKKGPLVASLILKHEIKIPHELIEDGSNGNDLPSLKRSTQIVTHEIETELILKRGSRILEFETRFDNRSVGHRLEAVLSTGLPIHTTFSENHFSLTRRYHQTKNETKIQLPVEPGCEVPCDRFPSQRFVIANGQMLLNRGLPEFGVDGDSLCITLLRSINHLSRGRMQTRGGGAGPHMPVPGAASLGANTVSFGWTPLNMQSRAKLLSDSLSSENIAEAYDLAEVYEQEVFCALSAIENSGTGPMLLCTDPAIKFGSIYRSDEPNSLIVRMLNVGNDLVTADLRVGFKFHSAHLCRLDEEPADEIFLYREYADSGKEGKEQAQHTLAEPCSFKINFGANELKTIKFKLIEEPNEQKARNAARPKRKKASSKIS